MSVYTARDVITGSLRLLGVLASGEAAEASEATDGLASLNDLLDSWSTENLLIPNHVIETVALVANQQTYTMGSGGNWNTARPLKIDNAIIQLPSTPVLDLPIKILNQDEYAAIALKTGTATYPSYLYSDNAYPLTSVRVWPVPTQAYNVVLYSQKALTQLAGLSTSLSLPPGYQRALRYALALELAPEYGIPVPATVAEVAGVAIANLKRINSRAAYLRADDALLNPSARWSIYSGDSV